MDLIAARGAGRSGFPVYPRTVSIYSNNYCKLHGMPMMRNVHLRKIEKKKIAKLQEEWIRTSLAFIGLGKAAERLTCTTREFIEMNKTMFQGNRSKLGVYDDENLNYKYQVKYKVEYIESMRGEIK